MSRSCSARTNACRVRTRVNAMVVPAHPRLHAQTRALRVLLGLLVCISAFAEPADWIYSARYVVTMDAQHRLIENGAVAIRGDRVAAVGPRSEIDRQFQPRHRLDRPDA